MADDGLVLRVDLDATGLTSALQAAPRKAARLARRFLLYHARRAVFESRLELSRIKTGKNLDPDKKDSGKTAQSITNSRVYLRGRSMTINIQWGVSHGKWLEWGPTKRQWIIRAKHAKALRFIWPMAPMGGFTATQTGTKGGQKVMSLTANVFHYRKVTHKWNRGMLRPHVGPAMEKIEPEFIQDMQSIPRLVFK